MKHNDNRIILSCTWRLSACGKSSWLHGSFWNLLIKLVFLIILTELLTMSGNVAFKLTNDNFIYVQLCTIFSHLSFLLHSTLSIHFPVNSLVSHSSCYFLHPQITKSFISSSLRWISFKYILRWHFFIHSSHVTIAVQLYIPYAI